ncbi:MAG: AAA family ATPase [Lachnospiraceae bacterium]|nr:AAA family ATPase [Lachnospiraceae bacterium]
MPKQKLIIIAGSPCVGKTTVTQELFTSYENSAFLMVIEHGVLILFQWMIRD